MRFIVIALSLILAWPVLAGVQPDEMLADPDLEARARILSKQIRCLQCQSESIDTSNADLARDFRILVRTRLTAGDTDQQVLDYFVARYGDFVLFKPPMKLKTVLLWFGPFLVLLLGAGVLIHSARRLRASAGLTALPLSAEERARLARLLESEPSL